MSILARLAWSLGGYGGGGVIQDDLNIVIKKQIDRSHVVLKRIGVVGVVVAVQAMVVAHTTDDEDMGQPVAESSRNIQVCLGSSCNEGSGCSIKVRRNSLCHEGSSSPWWPGSSPPLGCSASP